MRNYYNVSVKTKTERYKIIQVLASSSDDAMEIAEETEQSEILEFYEVEKVDVDQDEWSDYVQTI